MSRNDNNVGTSAAASSKGLAIKLGALVAGLAVVAYAGLRLGSGDVHVSIPFIGSSAPAAHVLTPEEQVKAEVAANPALVSRDACLNLYAGAPGYLLLVSHPTSADFDAMSDDELRSIVMTLPIPVRGLPVMLANHAGLVKGMTSVAQSPSFANLNTEVETRRITAYMDTCRSMYPSRDEAAANYVRIRTFTFIRYGRALLFPLLDRLDGGLMPNAM
ncbi:TPA: hypothetical protein QDB45_001726 [Burkholderia vietnamiensis]|nr:hypothetical protein [Burkholderia vietnamiensis]